MTEHRKSTEDSQGELRRRAEKRAAGEARFSSEDETTLSPWDLCTLVHELKVHQQELEMQNEELLHSQLLLDASRARYFDLFDLAPVGYLTLTGKGLILEANHTAAAMLNRTTQALIDAPITKFIFSDDQDIYYRHRKELLQTEQPRSCELRINRADAKEFWAHLISTIAQDENGEDFCRVALNDISARRQAEAESEALRTQLHLNRKMESVGRLAGGVAHEFNNMLGVIIGNAELALRKVPTENPIVDNLREILDASRRTADVTRHLLAFARMEINTPKLLDLNKTIDGMLKMLRHLIGPEIELDFRPARDLWWVRMDPSQINQILVNLCLNARDAIPGAGRITIETSHAVFDEAYCALHPENTPGDFVRLTVSDDGCGLDTATRENLFEPFFTTRELGKGCGLGLAAIHGIVMQNSGTIEFSSEPDQGTTFRIHLPRHISTRQSPPIQDQPSTGTDNWTILLVEDEPAILRMTKTMLERLGYTVLPASTPDEALFHEGSGRRHTAGAVAHPRAGIDTG